MARLGRSQPFKIKRFRPILSTSTNYSQPLSDSVTLSIAIVLKPVKKLADSFSLSEGFSNKPVKKTADSITLSDAVVTKPSLRKSDSVSFGEATSKRIVVSKSDTISLGEVFTDVVHFHLPLTASITLSEARRASVVKKNVDSITVSDLASERPSRNISDGITIGDSLVIKPRKNLSDTLILHDVRIDQIRKVLADSITIEEEQFETGNGTNKFFRKSINNTVTLVEGQAKKIKATRADIIIVTDSISGRHHQDLSDSIILTECETILLNGALAIKWYRENRKSFSTDDTHGWYNRAEKDFTRPSSC